MLKKSMNVFLDIKLSDEFPLFSFVFFFGCFFIFCIQSTLAHTLTLLFIMHDMYDIIFYFI